MAIRLEFIDFIVPIATIRSKYPGGWDKCLADVANLIGGRAWYDEHLFRDGAMNPCDIRFLVGEWEARGFTPMAEVVGQRAWKDACVVESIFGGPALPCNWPNVDPELRIACRLGGDPGGGISGRESFEHGQIKE